MSYTNLANAIEILVYPLKIFKVKPKEIGLIICMAVVFIPILKNELIEIKDALYIKGTKKIRYILKVFFISVLQRIDELEISLKAKAYEE